MLLWAFNLKDLLDSCLGKRSSHNECCVDLGVQNLNWRFLFLLLFARDLFINLNIYMGLILHCCFASVTRCLGFISIFEISRTLSVQHILAVAALCPATKTEESDQVPGSVLVCSRRPTSKIF